MSIRPKVVLGVLALLTQIVAVADTNLTGTWMFTLTSPADTYKPTATIQQDGERITGTIELPEGTFALTGTDKAGALNLSFVYDNFEPGLAITVTLVGTASGDTITGSVDYETFGAGEWNGRRKH